MANSLQGDGKAIFTFFIGAIIALVFLASIADSVFTQSTTFTVTNETITAGAINVSVALTGRELIDGDTPITLNASNTSALTLQTSGVTITTKIVNNVRTVALTVNDTASVWVGTSINVTYNYEPQGYLERAVDRNVVALITLFAALSIMVFAVVIFIKFGTLGNFMDGIRRKQ